MHKNAKRARNNSKFEHNTHVVACSPYINFLAIQTPSFPFVTPFFLSKHNEKIRYMIRLWYVSNVSISFDCSMLYYLLFWTLLGFIILFYIIFGTNLLTEGPAQNCCFCLFRVSKKRNIKWTPNGMKPSEMWFSHQIRSRRLGPPVKKATRWSPTYFSLLYIPTYPQTIWYGAKNLIPPPQLSVSTRSHLGACSGDLPEGASITEGFYINTIAPPMKCE